MGYRGLSGREGKVCSGEALVDITILDCEVLL